MKETEGERESDRDCPSWRSLLGAGSVFGSAHCIISISPNLPEQMEKGPTCSTSCIIKSFCLCAQRVYCTRSLTSSTVHPHSFRHTRRSPASSFSKHRHVQTLININTQCVSLEEIMTYTSLSLSLPLS